MEEVPWRIRIHPDRIPNDFGDYKLLGVVSALIHEAIHAFHGRSGCYSCRTMKYNGMAVNHGRPFQHIAARLEEVSPLLLGIPVYFGRVQSLYRHWKKVCPLLSLHDLTMFRFSKVKWASYQNLDIAILVGYIQALSNYQPYALLASLRYLGLPLINQDGVYSRIPEHDDA
jgi:hypothetical protein